MGTLLFAGSRVASLWPLMYGATLWRYDEFACRQSDAQFIDRDITGLHVVANSRHATRATK